MISYMICAPQNPLKDRNRPSEHSIDADAYVIGNSKEIKSEEPNLMTKWVGHTSL